MKERLRPIVTVVALLGLVIYLPFFILWCGPLVYLYNQEICDELGTANLWHLLLLACGVALCIFRPRTMGIRLGKLKEHLGLIALVSGVSWVVSAAAALLITDHPFEGAPAGMYLATPVAEELIFRGFAYTALVWAFPGKSTRLGLSYAVVGSALLFGIWHVSMAGTLTWGFAWVQAAYTSAAGLLLGLVRERTGSLLPCMGAHMGANFIVATI
jgi:membrane protease YdiL (CAAX protease family)